MPPLYTSDSPRNTPPDASVAMKALIFSFTTMNALMSPPTIATAAMIRRTTENGSPSFEDRPIVRYAVSVAIDAIERSN